MAKKDGTVDLRIQRNTKNTEINKAGIFRFN